MNGPTPMPNLAKIFERLGGVRAREENLALTHGLLRTVTAVAALSLLALGVEASAHLSIAARTIAFAALCTFSLASLATFAGASSLRRIGLLRRKTVDRVALEVGGHFPDIRDRLLNALQVRREMDADGHPHYSPALVDATFAEMAERFGALNLAPVVDSRPARRAGRTTVLACVSALAAFAVFPGALGGAATRLFHFRTDFAEPAPFAFVVLPGDVEAVKGERIALRARTTSPAHPAVTIHVREGAQEDFEQAPARSDSAGSAEYRIESIRSSLVYYAEAEGYRSRQYAVRVVDRPIVRSMRVRLAFPSYTKLPPRALDENVGDVTALTGTAATFELSLNKDVAKAEFVFADSSTLPLKVDGTRASGVLRIHGNTTYRARLVDEAGIENAHPITYAITVTPDLPPTVEVVDPGRDVDIDETMRLPLTVAISDDYGFSKLVLHYRLSSSRYEKAHDTYSDAAIPLPALQGTRLDVPYLWNLSSLSLVPQDVVQYYVEVFDNDAVHGPKSARSTTFTVRLPSLDEMYTKHDRSQDEAVDDLKKTLDNAEDVRKSLESLQREMKSQNTDKLDWQQKKRLEEAIKKQEQMLEDVKKVGEQLSQMRDDMQRQNLFSEETMRKYQELQQLMQQVDSPEFREAIKRMNEAMQQLTPEQMKQALENFTFNEEMFQKSIDRTMELLKRLQIEQKADELARRAEDLAKKQEDLAERTAKADASKKDDLERLAKEQQDLKEQTEAMQKALSELQKKMSELPPQDMPMQEMREAQEALNLADMEQQMNAASGECQGGQCQGASQKQRKLAAQMRTFQKKMDQVRKKLTEDQKRAVQQAFKRALENVLDLSEKQEKLRDQTRQLPMNSQQFREKLPMQLDLMEQLNNTAADLFELGKKSFQVSPEMGRHLGEAMKKMKSAMDDMQNRNGKSSGEQQGGAMAELNEAAKQIAEGMRSASSGGSNPGGSLMAQLQQMARQQAGINMGTQQTNGQTMQQMERLAAMQRLAQQQATLQKSLAQLNDEAKRSAEGRRLLGDLEHVAEQMQEVVRDLQQNDVNPNTLDKQEHILSRLLDASRSMHERDWEKKRRSESGTDVVRRSPDELDPHVLDSQTGLKRDLQKAIDEGYNRDYQARIRRYFDALQQVLGTPAPQAPSND